MCNLLYYTYINVPLTDWTLRTLLYYDNVCSIVPQEYFYEPEHNYDEFMLELVKQELVTPIIPIQREVSIPFINLLERNQTLQNNFIQKQIGEIHINKFSRTTNIYADKFVENLSAELGYLRHANQRSKHWFIIELRSTNGLISYLATIKSAKTNHLPTTDHIRSNLYKQSFNQESRKRKTLLTHLIPFFKEIDLSKLFRFKEWYSGLLSAFRTRVESIVLDPNIIEVSPLFYQNLNEWHQRKEELTARMNESKFNKIVFGTVCSLIGAYLRIITESTMGAIIDRLPGVVNAIYSALQLENAEDVFDHSGFKYLALTDKQLIRL
jgi:hypothetical protein